MGNSKQLAKKYTKISLTLGIIAAGAGLLIGGTHLLTKDTIAKNTETAMQNALKESFIEDCDFVKLTEEDNPIIKEVKSSEYEYVESVFTAKKAGTENIYGYAFVCSGRNSFGMIKMAIGIKSEDMHFDQIGLITNEQSFGQRLVDEYIYPFNHGQREIQDIKCGATKSATLVYNMAIDAMDFCTAMLKEGK